MKKLSVDRHIPGLDGIRAVAVMGVIGHHLGLWRTGRTFSLLAFGWTGVELFFVLSGFLITSILLTDKDSLHYFSIFYSRRSLRIFPIYYLLFFALLAWSVLSGASVSDWQWFATYTQNWLYASSETWANDGRIHFSWGASHTWSLAVEEQFYLLWPLMVRNLSSRSLLRLVFGLIVIGPLSRYASLAMTGRWWAGYTPLFCQVDMLAWGALGAICHHERLFLRDRDSLARFGLIIGAGAAMFARFGRDSIASPAAMFYSIKGQTFYAFLGPFFLCLLIVAMSRGLLSKALELHPIRYCGRISYGLYLYHWPILVLVESVTSWSWGYGSKYFVTVGGTFIVAAASYRWIERPILNSKDRLFPRPNEPSTGT
jgi:peptidoglycan/LPS O-acetylase OafA/YrhL